MHITEEHLRILVLRGQVPQAEADRVLGARGASPADAAVILGALAKPSKYHNVKTCVDGITFDSKREASRYMELRLAMRAGRVRNLTRQTAIPIIVNGVKVCDYLPDFRYEEFIAGEWRDVVEDVKSKPTMTDVYRLKKKLLKATLGIEIRETT